MQKSEIFFWTKKKTWIFSADLRDFFFGRKKTRIFSAEIEILFVQKKIPDFCTENPSFFFKKILCLSCMSHIFLVYRKIPITSPGLLFVQKGFFAGLIFGGAYFRRGLLS